MTPINFGVLMIPYQTVDAAMPLDVLGSCVSQMTLGEFQSAGFKLILYVVQINDGSLPVS